MEGAFLESEINDQELVIQQEDMSKRQKRKEVANKAWNTIKKKGR